VTAARVSLRHRCVRGCFARDFCRPTGQDHGVRVRGARASARPEVSCRYCDRNRCRGCYPARLNGPERSFGM